MLGTLRFMAIEGTNTEEYVKVTTLAVANRRGL